MSVITDLVGLIAKLGPAGMNALMAIVNAAFASGDPDRYLRRIAQAKAAHATTQATADALLKKTASKP